MKENYFKSTLRMSSHLLNRLGKLKILFLTFLLSCFSALTFVPASQAFYQQVISDDPPITEPNEEDYYQIRDVVVPDDIVLEVGGIALLPSGQLAVATRRGEIWTISNPAMENGSAPHFTKFAEGMYETLGLVYQDGSLYTSQRGELTRLTDTNGDGRADLYERVYAWPISGHYHEYSFGPAFLPNGNMVVTGNVAFGNPRWWEAESRVPWRGWSMIITPEGDMKPFSSGMRSPAGIAVNSRGEILYTENEGDWIGSGFLAHVEEGDFHGNPAGLRWADRPESPVDVRREDIVDSERPMYESAERVPGIKLPAVWIPHTLMGISTSDILEATDNSFGPYEGHYFIGDQGHALINRIVMEKVNGQYQGVVFPFRRGFASGVLRMEWGEDGAMYVGMTDRGWSSTGERGYGLQRLEWNGEVPFEMRNIEARPDGFEIEFTKPVDQERAANLAHYNVTNFTYMYRYDYGSPIIRQEEAPVRGLKISDDGLRVRIVVDNLREKYVHEVRLGEIHSEDGIPLLHNTGYYTLNYIPAGDALMDDELTAIIDPAQPRDVVSPATDLVQEESNAEEIREESDDLPVAKRVTELPESWVDGPDRTIRLGTKPGLQFDMETIEVNSGSKIRLEFINDDDMQHNVVIVQPGTADEVGEEAMLLGLQGPEMQYVPDNDNVLFYTAILRPGMSESIYFTAPDIPGEYTYVCTFPGHHIVMRGRLIVN
ncbi:plastocyanin/azurin family copper-binding protein [Rhodohalobacter sp. SW132]|uniref:plastocyanin/azurin family copper-binding protein n=1 Tax=Rhodohalobacter sp. SW132 TaxID=2293433 RepID=UPI0018F2D922|nr:plastocyanin/azurin family copper-binding protein [Rhodohalobacter sp. SW132]